MKILIAVVLLLTGSLQVARPEVATFIPAQDVIVRDAACLSLGSTAGCGADTVWPGGTEVKIYYVLYRSIAWGAIDPELEHYVPIGVLGTCVEPWFGALEINPTFHYLVEKC